MHIFTATGDAMTYTYPLHDPVALAAKLKAEGGPAIDPIPLTSGIAEEHGVKLSYVIGADSVSITVVSKPFYISQGAIKGELDKFFGESA